MTLPPDSSQGGGRIVPGAGPLLFLDVDGPLNKGWWTSPEEFPGLRDAGWHAGRVTGCPVHILQGMKDADVPYLHAMKLVEHLPADDVILTFIRDGDHRLSRPQDIERLRSAVKGLIH